MKIIVLSPNFDLVFTDEQKSFLDSKQAVIYKSPQPIHGISELKGEEQKILMIDPDFCDWDLKKDDIDSIENLTCVLLQTTSFSWLPVDYLTEKSIPVCNIKGFSGPAVADYLMLLALSLSRKLPLIIQNGYKQDFSKDFLGFELKGKRAGIIGLGTIGKLVAERCIGLGMEIVYWSPHSKNSSYTFIEVDELLKSADVVFPCFAINDASKNLLNNDALATMKSTALFVSPIHGIFDEIFLQERVQRGELAGVAYENGKADTAQVKGNCFILPDHAWMTSESMHRCGEGWHANLKATLAGNPINKIN